MQDTTATVVHNWIPSRLSFLESLLDNTYTRLSPRTSLKFERDTRYVTHARSDDTLSGEKLPAFRGSEVTIFLDWYNALDNSDKKSITSFLTRFDTWTKQERQWSGRQRRQLPYFTVSALGDSLQHGHYDQINLLIVTNRTREGDMRPEFSERFLDHLSQRFEISEFVPIPHTEFGDVHPRLRYETKSSPVYSARLTPKTGLGKPLQLYVAGLDSTYHLETATTIPKHAAVYKRGNTEGLATF